MSTALTVSHGSPVAAIPATIPAADAERARGFANAEKAGATRRAYGTDFAIFRAWCAERQLGTLPASPATVAAFLAHEAWHQDVSRHRSVDTLRGYIRDAELFKDHAGAGLL